MARREETGFGKGDGECFERTFCLEEVRELQELLQGLYPGLYPDATRTHTTILAETADTSTEHATGDCWRKKKRRNAALEPILAKLGSGEIEGGYLFDDERLLWYAPQGEDPKLAIPRVMVPGVLALVHNTFVNPGVARSTLLVQSENNWSTLAKDIHEYVVSCGCRGRK